MERGKVYLDLRDGCILSGNLIFTSCALFCKTWSGMRFLCVS